MELPVEPQIRWIVRRAASLLALGAEPVRGLVLPTAEFFPDRFDGTPRSVADLLARVQEHAGLSDLASELSIVTPEGETQSVGCNTGSCCGSSSGKLDLKLERVARRDDGTWVVRVSSGEVGNPVVLTTALVRGVAAMFMAEAGAYDDLPPLEREPATDLAAVLLGFGVLAANGSYVYMKGCGSVKVHSATKMPVQELALALAIFCTLHQIPPRSAAKHLDLTPREHFGVALEWASSNAALLKRMRSNRDAIEAGDFVLGETRGWLARALGIGRRTSIGAPSDEELAAVQRDLETARKRSVDPAKAKKLEELRALVDETRQG